MKSKINLNDTNIKKIFSKILKISLNEVKDNLSRENCKNWDSMNHVRLVLEIEKELKIKIDNNDAIDLDNFKTFCKFLKNK